MKIGDYLLEKKIYEDSKTSIYEAIHSNKHNKVIIKVLSGEYPSRTEIENMKMEFETVKRLSGKGLAKYLDLVPSGNGFAIVQESFEGIALESHLSQGSVNLSKFLSVAPLIVEALGELHKQEIVHRDISADNLLVSDDFSEVRLIDFGASTSFDQAGNEKLMGGKIHYISPEQTGRINRQVDYRTDLYSLGVLFYRMLSGKFPFDSEDTYQIIHKHIASVPLPIKNYESKIPPVIAAIVHKLLAKNPDERYQAAMGLAKDLERCISSYQENGTIKDFAIAQDDFSSIFRLPRQLFGRKKETKHLIEKCRTSIDKRNTLFLLVKGAPGIGKSSLVQELRKPLMEENGFFIEGKFELLQQPVPYSGLIRAFEGLLHQLMTEHKGKLTYWKGQLLTALGQNGRILTDVFPTLERIIGKQPEAESLNPGETQNRFEFVFSQFVKVFATQPFPITLFLDDLQWIDTASLHLLKQLLENNQDQMLLIIGAYRDNEVEESHPLSLMLEEIKKEHFAVDEIVLKNLPLKEVEKMVSYCLMRPTNQVAALGKLVYQKTKGNPFYIHRFIASLHEKKLLFPDMDKGLWNWNEEEIVNENITENVVDFLVKQMDKLPANARKYLSTGAAIGNQFSISDIVGLYGVPETEVNSGLKIAVKEAFVQQKENHYVFVHDRIHQAAYALINNKEALHLKVGRYFESIFNHKIDEDIFQITNQLNRSVSLISEPDEQLKLATWNLEGGIKAKDAIAFDASRDLLSRAAKLLSGHNPWEKYYELKWKLTFERIEVEFIRGNPKDAKEMAMEALQWARTKEEKASIYNQLTVFATMQINYSEALDFGKKGLKLLKLPIPTDTEIENAIGQSFMRIGGLMDGKSPNDLLKNPVLNTVESAALQIQLLVNMCSPAYLSGENNLWTYLVNLSTAISIEHGNIPESCTAYSSYGILCGLAFGDYQQGYAYGDLSYRLAKKLKSLKQRSNTCFVLGGFLNVYARPAKQSYQFLQEGLLTGLQSGELQFAGYNLSGFGQTTTVQGDPLSILMKRVNNGLAIAEKTKNQFVKSNLIAFYVFFRDLSGIITEDTNPQYAQASDEELFRQIEEAHNYSGKMFFFLYKGVVAYLLGRPSEAHEFIKKSGDLLFSVPGLIVQVDYHTYAALVVLELISSSDPDEELQKSLNETIAVLEKWNDSIPENFQFRLDLIHGIQKEMEKDYLVALDFYESAIELSSQQEVLPIKAIAAEKAGKMMLKIGHSRLGNLYLKDAYLTYSEYGAQIKLYDLENQFPAFFGKQGSGGSKSGIKSSTTLNSLEMFDSHTLVKASFAISQEITLKGVLTKMMEVVFENSGAEKGIFLLEENGKWKIEAKGSINPRKYKFLQGTDYPGSKKNRIVPPVEIVNYVQNTQKSLLIEDAQGSTDFGHLEHFKKNSVKSVLCLPVLRHRELKAILYLENSLSAGTFTSSQLELINTLSSQIAISITNAQLYEELEQKVLNRTAEIQSQKEELEKTLTNLRQTQAQLIQSEKMASLGELTAGIAHEIQNPLNFVNNFSDVNKELVDELEEEIEKGNTREAKAIARDIKENELKIIHHGKRAEEIVRSMLQHSRGSSGEKEPTDINQLVDEYIRLAYHGLRAKDKSFNVDFKLDLDEFLPRINVVPQDIGRVLLNLINNAFYSVDKKAKSGIDGYKPEVVIRTKKHDGSIEISVMDNGEGVPEQVRDKIFQPFFTTKSTGKGTGLGLSLSYDIITKGHGGKLKLESNNEKGTILLIILPV